MSFLRLLTVLLLVSAPCSGADITNRSPASDQAAEAGGQLLAGIDQVGDNQYRYAELELTVDTTVRVTAIGEGRGLAMLDYGGIEDTRRGELVWEMFYLATEPAGGDPRNRQVDRLLPLPAGSYRLHYRSDGGHSAARWLAAPPDQGWWGIRLYDAGAAAAPSWPRARPATLGWSAQQLQELRRILPLQSTALMIVTDGKVVFEWGRITNNLAAHSVRKSLLNALYGIAVAEGSIDLEATLQELGIEEQVPLDRQEQQATVADLLASRSGVYLPAAAEVEAMRRQRPRRHAYPPGSHWYYNNWDFNVLGTIYRQQTGEDIYEAFERCIATPLGMQDFRVEQQAYVRQDQYSQHPAYPFRISTRDLARFGQLYLQNGRWQGEQLIPAEWVARSTRALSRTDRRQIGYGYLWWVVTGDLCGLQAGDYYASGLGGQMIFVLPRIATVVVHRTNLFLPGVDREVSSRASFRIMRRIMAARTGWRAAAPEVAAVRAHPRRELLPDYRPALQRARAGRRLPQVTGPLATARIWLALCIASLLVAVVRELRGPRAWRRVPAAALLGPLGLLATAVPQADSTGPEPRAGWQCALATALHSLPAYLLALSVTTAVGCSFFPQAEAGKLLLAGYGALLVCGLLVRAPLVGRRCGIGFWRAIRRALLVEVVAVNLLAAGVLPVIVTLRTRWYPGDIGLPELTTSVSWLGVSLVAGAGTIPLLILGTWLCRRRFAAVLPLPATFTDGRTTPGLGDAWSLLLGSLALLVVSVTGSVLLALALGWA